GRGGRLGTRQGGRQENPRRSRRGKPRRAGSRPKPYPARPPPVRHPRVSSLSPHLSQKADRSGDNSRPLKQESRIKNESETLPREICSPAFQFGRIAKPRLLSSNRGRDAAWGTGSADADHVAFRLQPQILAPVTRL